MVRSEQAKVLTVVTLVGSYSLRRVLLAGEGIFHFVHKTRHDVWV